MAQTRKISFGNNFNHFTLIDSNAWYTGGSPTAPSSGATVSNARRLWGIKTASPTIPAPEVVQSTGDDGLLGEQMFDSIESRSYQFTTAIEDFDNIAAVTGTNVVTYGSIQALAIGIAENPFYDVAIIHSSRAKSQKSPKGKSQWTTYFLPSATLQFQGRDAFTEREAGVYNGTIVPQLGTYDMGGFTILEANYGVCGAYIIAVDTDYPVSMAAFTGNGVATAFTGLDYDPVRTTGTLVSVDRVAATVNSVQTGATKGFTLSAAPRDGGRGVVFYEFDPSSCS